jgi:hypothetical protein
MILDDDESEARTEPSPEPVLLADSKCTSSYFSHPEGLDKQRRLEAREDGAIHVQLG